MTGTDVVATLFALLVLLLASLGIEKVYRQIRVTYLTWRVQRLIRRETRAFQQYVRSQRF